MRSQDTAQRSLAHCIGWIAAWLSLTLALVRSIATGMSLSATDTCGLYPFHFP